MDVPLPIIVWVALVIAFLGVAGYRWLLTRREDDIVHVRDSEANLISSQATLANRMHKLDVWGRILMAATIVYGLALAGYYMYRQFEHGTRLPGS